METTPRRTADLWWFAPSGVAVPGALASGLAPAPFGNSITASMRGFGQGDINRAFELGVGLYIDDVRPRLTGANSGLLDVDQVENPPRNAEGPQLGSRVNPFLLARADGGGGGYVAATHRGRERIRGGA